MTKYQGCKCPICQKEFTEQDDIVVCPDCGTPYHRDCWKEHGGCVFADRHGTGFEFRHPDEGPQSLDESPEIHTSQEQVCPGCGAKNPANNIFCESCGAPLHGIEATPHFPNQQNPMTQEQSEMFSMAGITPDQEIDGIPVRDWATYLGRSAPYYTIIFHRMEQTRRKIFPSLCGFFFGPLFLLYRKVWIVGAASAAISALCSVPTLLMMILASNNPSAQPAEFLLAAQQICSILSILLQVALMLYSFYIIRWDGARKIRRFRQQASSAEEYQRLLQKKSAPSWVGILVYLGILVVLSLLLAPFFGPHLEEALLGPLTLF